MVSIRSVHQTQRPAFHKWLDDLSLSESTKEKLRTISDSPETLLIGQEMVEILQQLHMDDETLQAALVYPYSENHQLTHQDLLERFGDKITYLVESVRKMKAINTLQSKRVNSDALQIENLRNMLLAMVEDVRAIVIKMAERICYLHKVKDQEEETRVLVAKECATIYAPLANRLGIGQLKWELEDLSFRYLHPKTYKKIAKMLNEKRSAREQYIIDFVDSLQALLDKENIKAEVIGRPKHIYSIFKKMQKKSLDFEQLFDIRALRIIADRLQDCYAALGTVHAHFKHIPSEFDDYIATPKANGYQSIHTVVVGPESKSIEIQIRTNDMHQHAELGVAAHWRYKEGSTGASASNDERVNWLRKILQWQEEMAESDSIIEEFRSQVFDDRVYVFTPKGDVIDLPVGATPLDFAYYIHSNVGHRCTGAKVNGRIVPFTYRLQNGDQVTVLTTKNGVPSRDWMHPGLGYVHTSRARATIHSYFKKQDKEKNIEAGKELLERELLKVDLKLKHANDILEKYNVRTADDLYCAVGAGDLRVMNVINSVLNVHGIAKTSDTDKLPIKKPRKTPSKVSKDAIIAEGVGNLLSQLANCCKPVPGESIVGYITQGKGVSVHKESCTQLEHLLSQHPEREIEVKWAQDQGSNAGFETKVELFTNDRAGILRDITTVLANEKIGLLGVNSRSDKSNYKAHITVSIEVKNREALLKVMEKLKQVKDVSDVRRVKH